MSETPEPVPVIIPCEMIWQGTATSIGAGSHPYEEFCSKPSTKRIMIEDNLYDTCEPCAQKAVAELGAILIEPVAD